MVRYGKSGILCGDATLRSALSSLVIAVSLAACRPSATNQQLEPKPDETTGVTLVLVPGGDSIGCCRVFTVNRVEQT